MAYGALRASSSLLVKSGVNEQFEAAMASRPPASRSMTQRTVSTASSAFRIWSIAAITAPPLVTSQAGFSPLGRDIIAFAYQFGSLILPAVVPAVAWVLTHRAFLEQMRAARGAA